MANQIIRPDDLPPRANPVASEVVPSDNGVIVAGVTWVDGVNAGRPLASQNEAEAGVQATKAMTPLTTKQAIEAQAPAIISTELGKIDISGVESRAWAIANMHPISAPSFIRTAGYFVPVDGGGGLYRQALTEPSHAGKFSITLDDGGVQWYELAETSITPLMVGARRNNALDQSASFQAWLGVLKAIGAGGYVPEGVYKIDSGISTDASDLSVRCHPDAVFDMGSAPVGAFGLTIAGSIGEYVNISSGQAQEGATRIQTGASFAQSLAIGDIIKIKSDDIFDSSNTSAKHGELNRVVGLVDASTGYIDLEIPLSFTYVTAPQAAKVTPVRNLEWHGGRWVGNPTNMNNQRAFQMEYVVNFNVSGISTRRMDSRGISATNCAWGDIGNVDIADVQPASTGYGVSVADAAQDIIVHHGRFSQIRHAFSTNNQIALGSGIPRRVTFADNICTGGAYAQSGSEGPGDQIDTHGAAEDIYIERNTVIGSPGQGINFECRSGVIRDNKIIGCANNGINYHNESDRAGRMIISGNTVRGVIGFGITARHGTRGTTAVISNLIVSNNLVETPSQHGIEIGSSSQSGTSLGVVVSGNVVVNAGGTGILVRHSRGVSVTGNNVRVAPGGQVAMRIFDCAGFVANDNSLSHVNGNTAHGLYVSATVAGASNKGTVSGNTITSLTGSFTGMGVYLDDGVEYTQVVGNNLYTSAGVRLGSGTGNVQANNLT